MQPTNVDSKYEDLCAFVCVVPLTCVKVVGLVNTCELDNEMNNSTVRQRALATWKRADVVNGVLARLGLCADVL